MSEVSKVSQKLEVILTETWHTFLFEVERNFEFIKSKSFFIYLFALASLFLILFKQNLLAIISIFLTLTSIKYSNLKGFSFYFFMLFALIFILVDKPILSILALFLAIIWQFKADREAGLVTRYIRQKKGILSKSEIKKLKEENYD